MLMACPPSGLVSKHTHVMFEGSGSVSALIKCSCLRGLLLLLSRQYHYGRDIFSKILIQKGYIFIQANGYWVMGYGFGTEQSIVRLKMRFDSAYTQLQAYLTKTSFAQ